MRKALSIIMFIVALGTFCQLFAVINTFPYTESFESATFPPDGWVLGSVNGPHNLELMTKDPENPTVYDTPHGNNWVSLQSTPESHNDAILLSPRLDFPAGNAFYQITLSIYVTNNTASNIQINRGPSESVVSPFMGQISNTDNTTSVGWHDYSIGLGFVGGTSQYIALTVGDFYEDINFDNIRIEEGNPWNNIYPYDNSTDVSYVWTGWSQYTVYDGNYSLYLSTDNTNFTLEYQDIYNSTTLADVSLSNTTYYWYVVANEYGNTVTSPTWSFTTGETPIDPPIDPPTAIADFPYLADFQVEDSLWTTFPVGKKTNIGKLNTSLNKTPLLQTESSNMSKYEDGFWVRTLDNEANYAWMLPRYVASALAAPYFHLIGGQTYEIKYNYRQSELSESTNLEGIVLASDPNLSTDDFLDVNFSMTNTDYALRMITITPENTGDYMFGFMGFSSVDIYLDNFRITQNGDDLLTAAAPTLGGISTPNPAPIFNTETGQALDTNLHIANITGTPEITATISWTPPAVGSQNTGLKLNLHSSLGGLSGANVTFMHNLGYPPLSIAYRIVPNAFATMYNPNNGSWNATQCSFTVPSVKADGDYEVILQLNSDQTLPVELSSFTSTLTSENYVSLQWVTQSETNHLGYNVLRATSNNLHSAIKVNTNPISEGTSLGTQTTYNFVDDEVVMDNTYYFWLESISMNGFTEAYGPLMAVLGQPADPDNPPVIPVATGLHNAYPNPFSSNATLPYSLKDEQTVRFDIYSVKGQLIRSYGSEHKAAGNHSLSWDGKDANGKEVTSGVYFYRMSAGKYTATRKLMFVK